MPGIEIKAFEELRRNPEHTSRHVLDRAIRTAVEAAARLTRAGQSFINKFDGINR